MNEEEGKTNNEINDDLEEYLREMEELQSDFSDLEDLDLEEIQEMKEAIEKVKQNESTITSEKVENEFTREEESASEVPESSEKYLESESKSQLNSEPISETKRDLEEEPFSEDYVPESNQLFAEKEELITDFSDIGKMDLDELLEMKEAVESVKHESVQLQEEGLGSSKSESYEMTSELERRLQEELKKKKEKQKEKEIFTKEKLLDYFKDRRDKIWYHALYYLAFEVEDHIASKFLLYEMLKEVTSKSAIDPIPEHSFYFGLGYILRLTLNERQIVRYMSGSKFKINVNVETIKSILEEAGEPIITRPVIEEEKKKKMFKDFLNEDFEDI